jgi:hypothetical protein
MLEFAGRTVNIAPREAEAGQIRTELRRMGDGGAVKGHRELIGFLRSELHSAEQELAAARNRRTQLSQSKQPGG